MRLNLRDIIQVPGESRSFEFALDLSELDFFGERPVTQPVQVTGTVRNRAGALVLEGIAETELSLTCDRCLKSFHCATCVPVDTMLAESLENEENDEIVLLQRGEVDLGELFTTAFVLNMDSKHICSEDCAGLCAQCGTDLNGSQCSCTTNVDPRFAALAQLLDKESD